MVIDLCLWAFEVFVVVVVLLKIYDNIKRR